MTHSTLWLNPSFVKVPEAPVVFTDRDGTLLKHVDYLGDPEQVELLPGVSDAMHALLDAGAAVFLFTNQSGVARGYYTLSDVHLCHERMFDLLQIEEEQLAGYCIATGMPDGDDAYRKPSQNFIREALCRFNFDDRNVHMIGDSEADLQTAQNAAVHAWLVGNGKPEAVEAHYANQLDYDYVFRPDFAACVRSILASAS